MNLHLDWETKHNLTTGAHLVVSVSGGKDSDTMSLLLYELWRELPKRNRGEFVLIHADVNGFEWPESWPHCKMMAQELFPEAELFKVTHHSGKTFFEAGLEARMVKRPDAPPFPSSAARWCTSDWKRGPISKFIRNRYLQDAIVYSAIGLRAEESPARAKKPYIQERKTAIAPTKKRYVYDIHPILDFTLEEVWSTLLPDGGLDLLRWHQDFYNRQGSVHSMWGYHPAYVYGNERVSCTMCVMASHNDLVIGAEHNPEMCQDLLQIEEQSGFTFQQNKSIREYMK